MVCRPASRLYGGVILATTNKNGARGGGAGRAAAGFFKVLGTLLLIGVVTAAFLACFGAVYIKEVILPDAHVEAQAYSTALASTIYYTGPPARRWSSSLFTALRTGCGSPTVRSPKT